MSEWTGNPDPAPDAAAMAEAAAKAADALAHAKRAALDGDGGPARELDEAARQEGERTEAANRRARIAAAVTPAELASLAPDPVGELAPLPFGAPLPDPVLWRDTGATSNPERDGTVLCRGEIAVLSGPGESGKSTVTIAIADAARDGGSACGLHVARSRVAVLSYEDSGARLAHRFGWYAGPEAWAHVRRARGFGPLWEADPADRRDSGPSRSWRPWWDAVADFGAGVVVIDPASVAASGISPSDGAAVRAFLLGVTGEAERIGAGVLIVAHDTKAARNEARAGIGPGPGAVSGSGQWSDGARAVLHLSGAGPDDKRLLVAAKSNYGPGRWGARLAPRWDGVRWRGLSLDTGEARLSPLRVAATRTAWAKAPAEAQADTAGGAGGNGGGAWRERVVK